MEERHGFLKLLLHILDLFRFFHELLDALEELQTSHLLDLFLHANENTVEERGKSILVS